MDNENDTFAADFLREASSHTLAAWIRHLYDHQQYAVAIQVGAPFAHIYRFHYSYVLYLARAYIAEQQYANAQTCLDTLLLHHSLTSHQTHDVWVYYAQLIHAWLQHTPNAFQHPYSATEVSRIMEARIHPPAPSTGLRPRLITVTMTTCRRLDLFERTINSFLDMCTDHVYVDQWICIDDNSSPSDRARMQERYPFFEFLWKDETQKGHAISMNSLVEAIQTPFQFHIEDDWEFCVRRPYLQMCLRVLAENPQYGQCLLNRNYAEESLDWIRIGGGTYRSIEGNHVRYWIHEHCDAATFSARYGNVPNCAYWPHYSLRVGMSRTHILRAIGAYNVQAGHFEREFADRYTAQGYLTTFLEGFACTHIGRKTYERANPNQYNAYDLNHQIQFGEEYQVQRIRRKFWYINLARRKDRAETFTAQFSPEEQNRWNRFAAVDGKKLVATRAMEQLFARNDYRWRRGIIGCALSHMSLWCQLLEDTAHDQYVILEDDATVCNGFLECIARIPSTTTNGRNWDICFLGCHLYAPIEAYNFQRLPGTIQTHQWNSIDALSRSQGGTTGYMITKEGARQLLDWVHEQQMCNAIDTMMQHFASIGTVAMCSPHIVHAPCVTATTIRDVDTDIQRDYQSLHRPLNDRIRDEIRWWNEQECATQTILRPEDATEDTVAFVVRKGDDTSPPWDPTQIPSTMKWWFLDSRAWIVIPSAFALEANQFGLRTSSGSYCAEEIYYMIDDTLPDTLET